MRRALGVLLALAAGCDVGAAAAEERPPNELESWQRDPPELDEEEPDVHRFTAKIAAGAGAHLLYGDAVYGADLSLAIGGNALSHPGHYHVALGALVGRTEGGLPLQHFRVGALLEWSVDRGRIGVTPELGFLLIHRITREGVVGSFSLGLAVHGSYDLVQFFEDRPRPGALYLGLRGGFDFLLQAEPYTPLLGGSLALGVRF